MAARRSKSERVHLPMLNLALQQSELAGKPAWPDKFIIPKHLMLKGSKRRQFISQTNIKPYRKTLKTEERSLMQPLSELAELSKFFEKNFGKVQQRKPHFAELDKLENRYQETIRRAHSRVTAGHQIATTDRQLNPEKERELLDEFNRQLHVKRWGQLGLVIKSENERRQSRHNVQRRVSHLKTDN